MRFPWIKRDCAGAGRCRLRSHHVERLFPAQGTPAAIVKKLNAAVVDAMESPAVKERMQELGIDLVAPERRTPQYLQTFVENEIAKWAGPIKAAGISID
jgi:tripartite-type tricarboxylate transporter receptor subunit TctC